MSKRTDLLYKKLGEGFIKSIDIDMAGRIFIHFEDGSNYLASLSPECIITDEKAEKIRKFMKKNPGAINEHKTYTKV